jgi:hypothetical protein
MAMPTPQDAAAMPTALVELPHPASTTPAAPATQTAVELTRAALSKQHHTHNPAVRLCPHPGGASPRSPPLPERPPRHDRTWTSRHHRYQNSASIRFTVSPHVPHSGHRLRLRPPPHTTAEDSRRLDALLQQFPVGRAIGQRRHLKTPMEDPNTGIPLTIARSKCPGRHRRGKRYHLQHAYRKNFRRADHWEVRT